MICKPKVIWAPQPGSQTAFLSCPFFEVLYEGTRGPGKTDAMLMDFAQHVGQGHGAHWRGIMFRRTFKELADVVTKARQWFHQIFPEAKFNQGDYTWTWPGGEALLLSYFDREDDYWRYHGHEYPWIGWEELTNWPSNDGYLMMMSCCRSSSPGMPRKYRATANPYGVGHNWVRARFIDPAPAGVPIVDDEGQTRVRVHGTIWENKILLEHDPDYLAKIRAVAESDPQLKAAWLEGSWDIVAGGMFDDLWRVERHVVEPFQVPKSWRVFRCLDWGSSAPFAVLWIAEANGTAPKRNDGVELSIPRGTAVVVSEWYGWTGKPNDGCRMTAREVARGIVEREKALGLNVVKGPADSAIFARDGSHCTADEMAAVGVTWQPSSKGPDSRRNGWEAIRQRLKASAVVPREERGLLVFDSCRQLIRTLPTLPRDRVKVDDVDTDAEDHLADALRYALTTPRCDVGTVEAPW